MKTGDPLTRPFAKGPLALKKIGDPFSRPFAIIETKEPCKTAGIPQIPTEEPCMITGIPTEKKTQNQNRSITNLRTQNSDPCLGSQNSESKTKTMRQAGRQTQQN